MHHRVLTLVGLLLVLMVSSACQRPNVIGVVERISDKGFTEVRVLSVEVTSDNDNFLAFGGYEWRWGSDDPAETRQIREIRIQIPDKTIVLIGAVLSGIAEVYTGDVQVLTKGNDTLIKFTGGDAAGSYSAAILMRDNGVTQRFCEHGEMGEEKCESMTITKDRVIINTHDEFEP